MIELLPALLQPRPSALTSDMMQFFIVTAVFVVVVSVATFYIFKGLRKSTDAGVKAQLDAEFEKTKDALLLAAQAKKQRSQQHQDQAREADKELKERELLRENVNPELVIGQADPISGLIMEADMELIIDPYTGQGYLLPSFLNDWPAAQERPKFVYRYPQGTVVKTSELVRGL